MGLLVAAAFYAVTQHWSQEALPTAWRWVAITNLEYHLLDEQDRARAKVWRDYKWQSSVCSGSDDEPASAMRRTVRALKAAGCPEPQEKL